jgi:hypothetical protein
MCQCWNYFDLRSLLVTRGGRNRRGKEKGRERRREEGQRRREGKEGRGGTRDRWIKHSTKWINGQQVGLSYRISIFNSKCYFTRCISKNRYSSNSGTTS